MTLRPKALCKRDSPREIEWFHIRRMQIRKEWIWIIHELQ